MRSYHPEIVWLIHVRAIHHAVVVGESLAGAWAVKYSRKDRRFEHSPAPEHFRDRLLREYLGSKEVPSAHCYSIGQCNSSYEEITYGTEDFSIGEERLRVVLLELLENRKRCSTRSESVASYSPELCETKSAPLSTTVEQNICWNAIRIPKESTSQRIGIRV